jgi:hypothetical protein
MSTPNISFTSSTVKRYSTVRWRAPTKPTRLLQSLSGMTFVEAGKSMIRPSRSTISGSCWSAAIDAPAPPSRRRPVLDLAFAASSARRFRWSSAPGVGQLLGHAGPRAGLALEAELDIADAGRAGAADQLLHAGLEVDGLLLAQRLANRISSVLPIFWILLPALPCPAGSRHQRLRLLEAGRHLRRGRAARPSSHRRSAAAGRGLHLLRAAGSSAWPSSGCRVLVPDGEVERLAARATAFGFLA